jgi:hypothetical protein
MCSTPAGILAGRVYKWESQFNFLAFTFALQKGAYYLFGGRRVAKARSTFWSDLNLFYFSRHDGLEGHHAAFQGWTDSNLYALLLLAKVTETKSDFSWPFARILLFNLRYEEPTEH